jgi:putative solute:sodium symporter small subunit
MARAHRKYWRFNLALIATLMTLGFIVSFVLPLIAPALAQMRVGGFRLPFYFGAQGAILIYLALIVVYIVLMQRADRRLQRAFDADASADAGRDASADVSAHTSADACADISADAGAPSARGH